MNERLRGTIEITASMTVLGTIGWVVVASGQPATVVVFWRCLFGALSLALVCGVLGHLRRPSARVLAYAGASGVALVLNWALLFASFPKASISVSTAVYSTQPFMLLGLGALFLGERITAAKLSWLVLAFAGLLLIVQGKAGHQGSDYLTGVVMAFAAGFFYALTALLTKKLAGTPPHFIALIQVCVGSLMLAPFADLAHPPAGAQAWWCLVLLGVVYTGLLFTLQYAGMQRLPTHLIGSLYFLYPAVAILVDAVVFGQRLSAGQILGAATILFAAIGMNMGWRLTRPAPSA